MEKYNFVQYGIHPTIIEKDYLNVLYSRFVDIRNSIINNDFIKNAPNYRLFQIKELFSIYVECLKYEPIRNFVNSGDFNLIYHPFIMGLFTNLRHLLSHFPLAESWIEIKFKKSWLTVFDKNSRIERFLTEYTGDIGTITLTNPYTIKPIIVTVGIPYEFNNDELISLEDIINEKSGSIVFTIIISLVLGTQLKDYEMPFDKSKTSLLVKKKEVS